MKYREPLTIHHKLPESWGGHLVPNNMVQLKETTHRALHTVFQNDTPIQRLRRLIEVDKSTLHPDVYREIDKVLARYEGVMEMQVYDPRIFNSDKFLKQGKSSR